MSRESRADKRAQRQESTTYGLGGAGRKVTLADMSLKGEAMAQMGRQREQLIASDHTNRLLHEQNQMLGHLLTEQNRMIAKQNELLAGILGALAGNR